MRAPLTPSKKLAPLQSRALQRMNRELNKVQESVSPKYTSAERADLGLVRALLQRCAGKTCSHVCCGPSVQHHQRVATLPQQLTPPPHAHPATPPRLTAAPLPAPRTTGGRIRRHYGHHQTERHRARHGGADLGGAGRREAHPDSQQRRRRGDHAAVGSRHAARDAEREGPRGTLFDRSIGLFSFLRLRASQDTQDRRIGAFIGHTLAGFWYRARAEHSASWR